MSKWTLAIAGLALCALGFGVAAWVVPPVVVSGQPVTRVAADPAPAPVVKWEYAQFQIENGEVILMLPGEKERKFDTYKALCQHLGRKTELNRSGEVLNAFGADGWELATQSTVYGVGFRGEYWTLKRPLRK